VSDLAHDAMQEHADRLQRERDEWKHAALSEHATVDKLEAELLALRSSASERPVMGEGKWTWLPVEEPTSGEPERVLIHPSGEPQGVKFENPLYHWIPEMVRALNASSSRDAEVERLTTAVERLNLAARLADADCVSALGEVVTLTARLAAAEEALKKADDLDATIPWGCLHDEYLHPGYEDECEKALGDAVHAYSAARSSTAPQEPKP